MSRANDAYALADLANHRIIASGGNASADYHAIGSYVMASFAGGSIVEPNTLVPGSALRMAGAMAAAGINGVSNVWSFGQNSTVSLPGTWRCMGYIGTQQVDMSFSIPVTLWTRVN